MDTGIRLYDADGTTRDVPTARIGHLEITSRRDLVLGFGDLDHPHLRIPMTRLTAEDRFDQLHQQLEGSGHLYSVAEGGVLQHSQPTSLDLLLPPSQPTTQITSEAERGRSRADLQTFSARTHDREILVFSSSHRRTGTRTVCRVLDGDHSQPAFRLMHGRVLCGDGVVVGTFHVSHRLAKGKSGPPTGFRLRTIGNHRIEYDANRRVLSVGGVCGGIVPTPQGPQLRLEQPIDPRLGLLSFVLTRTASTAQRASDPLRWARDPEDNSLAATEPKSDPSAATGTEPTSDFSESPLWFLRYLPPLLLCLPALIKATTNSVSKSFFLLSLIVVSWALVTAIGHRVLRMTPSRQSRCRRGKRALHFSDDDIMLCNGLGYHTPPSNRSSIGHVDVGSWFTVVTTGFKQERLEYCSLSLSKERRQSLITTLQNRPKGSLFTWRNAQGEVHSTPWTWSDLLPDQSSITRAQILTPRAPRFRLIVSSERDYEVIRSSRSTLVTIDDTVGSSPLFQVRTDDARWHNGAVLGSLHRQADHVTLVTTQGATLRVDQTTILLDGQPLATCRADAMGTEFTLSEPVPEAILALAVGMAARFGIHPTPYSSV